MVVNHGTHPPASQPSVFFTRFKFDNCNYDICAHFPARFSDVEIQVKVDAYRAMLLGSSNKSKESTTKDEHGRPM